jgi:hypothetical protein
VLAYKPTYLGGAEAQEPVTAEEEDARERAADFTPAPGTLFSLAMITPAGGVPKLALRPTAEVLAAALASAAAEPEPAGAADALVLVDADGRYPADAKR